MAKVNFGFCCTLTVADKFGDQYTVLVMDMTEFFKAGNDAEIPATDESGSQCWLVKGDLLLISVEGV